jgi:hypothetical protein
MRASTTTAIADQTCLSCHQDVLAFRTTLRQRRDARAAA